MIVLMDAKSVSSKHFQMPFKNILGRQLYSILKRKNKGVILYGEDKYID
jgi:hypothetical protein